MDFVIELNKGVLPFLLNDPIELYLSKYPNVFTESPDGESWDDYDFFDNTIEVFVNKQSRTIESIACSSNCYLNGQNLINLPFKKFIQQFNIDESMYQVEKISLLEEDQDVYDIDGMNLQLWVNTNNEIVTVFVH